MTWRGTEQINTFAHEMLESIGNDIQKSCLPLHKTGLEALKEPLRQGDFTICMRMSHGKNCKNVVCKDKNSYGQIMIGHDNSGKRVYESCHVVVCWAKGFLPLNYELNLRQLEEDVGVWNSCTQEEREHLKQPQWNKHPVVHVCSTKDCVNPWHLSWGTPKENAQTREAKRRRDWRKGEGVEEQALKWRVKKNE